MVTSLILAIAMALALSAAAFCAGQETAFLSAPRGRVIHLARAGSSAAKTVEAALADISRTMTGLLVGNNLANVVFSVSSAALAERLFPESRSANAVWSVVAALSVVYLSEFMPKLLCSTRPLRRSLRLAPVYRVFRAASAPLTSFAVALTNVFVRPAPPKPKLSTADLLGALKDRKDGVCLTELESALVCRILVLRQRGEAIGRDNLLSAIDGVA